MINDDYVIDNLSTRGYKPKKDSVLMRMNKKELIDLIRILECNWAVEINWLDIQCERVKIFGEYMKKVEKTDEFNKLMNEELKFKEENKNGK